MISFVVVILILTACVSLAVHLARGHTERRRDHTLPPLLFPLHAEDEERRLAPSDDDAVSGGQPVDDAGTPEGNGAAQHHPAETMRFRRDDAPQLLPGHLEVEAGLEPRRQIRLVRLPGQPTRTILGRDPGDSPLHVALPSRTVSRRHACLAFDDGRWKVTNLSRTNPVVVNDETLANVDDERLLTDGDRIELGEVVLRFHTG